jgi:hypothetical protein
MTEDEEVTWINSLGFKVTVADLRASYKSFVPKALSSTVNVLWGTESDELRNLFRLYRRTGYAPFLAQAQSWRDFMVNVYSQWQNGGHNVVEPEHVYLMGLIDWYTVYKDQPTLDAINRILDFIEQKVTPAPFYETRVSARCIQCLSYYLEKIGTRRADVLPKLEAFVSGIETAHQVAGLVVMKFLVGTGEQPSFMPATDDLTKLFPGDTKAGIVTGPGTYQLKGFEGAGVYQDCMLIHALEVAGRVLAKPSLQALALQIANAWVPHVVPPFWDPNGIQYNLLVPYYMIQAAPETALFHAPDAASSPLYVTQFAANCPDARLRKLLGEESLLRQYGQYAKIAASELGGKPRYFPWQTFQEGYFLTQK